MTQERMDGPGVLAFVDCLALASSRLGASKDFSKARDWELREWAKGGRWITETTQKQAIEEMERRCRCRCKRESKS